MKNFEVNYKSLIPAVVASGVVLYEALTGHQVKESLQHTITNDGIAVVGFAITLVGIAKTHFKKKEVK